jgi:ribonuclease G
MTPSGWFKSSLQVERDDIMKRILMDICTDISRTAVVENGRLVDLIVEKKNTRSITGNVYLGLVKNILPNQFAFVDIGQPKNGFLNVVEMNQKISLKSGQSILVQVRKDPSGDKGASLSRQLDMIGRYVVLFQSCSHEIGVSHKIKDAHERERLKDAAKQRLPEGYGIIMRTSSENKPVEDIFLDIDKQVALYKDVIEKGPMQKAPALIYQENNVLRELLREDVEEVIINDPSQLEMVKEEVEYCRAGLSRQVRLHEGAEPLFDANLEKQADRALDKKIWLDCGGFLIIEQTEACVIVDVNTGKYIGRKSRRDSILQANLEAAKDIAAQIRLRNLSGMIIIDFINMEHEEDIRQLYNFFSAEIAKDRIKTNIIGMTELGLMQITRRKTRESLGRILLEDCPYCGGSGHLSRSRASKIHTDAEA